MKLLCSRHTPTNRIQWQFQNALLQHINWYLRQCGTREPFHFNYNGYLNSSAYIILQLPKLETYLKKLLHIIKRNLFDKVSNQEFTYVLKNDDFNKHNINPSTTANNLLKMLQVNKPWSYLCDHTIDLTLTWCTQESTIKSTELYTLTIVKRH